MLNNREITGSGPCNPEYGSLERNSPGIGEPGIGKSYISQIESGAKIGSVKCLHRIAEALGVDVNDLIVNDDS